MSSDQWGASAGQPDGGSWPPQPAPAYPAAPGHPYPPQPPTPPGPAEPYAQPPAAPGSAWEPSQSGGYAAQMPSQPSYTQSGYPSDPYQVSGYPTYDPYAVPSAATSAPGVSAPPGPAPGYPQGSGDYAQSGAQQPGGSQPDAPQYAQQHAPYAQPEPRHGRQDAQYAQQEAPQYAQQEAQSYASAPPPPATYPSAPYPQPYPPQDRSQSQPPYQPPAQSQPQPPQQPQHAQSPQPPQPQPIPYPEPPFPQAPGGPPVPTAADGAAGARNGFALTGALTSIVPIVGLAFSIVGLTKAKVLGGLGRRLAVLGVTLSLVFTAAWGVGGFYVFQVADSTAADPGCVAATGDYLAYSQDLGTDASAIGKTTYGTPQFISAVQQYEGDLESLIGKFQADAARANHASVRTAITSLVGDLQRLKTVMGDLVTGDFSDVDGLGDISTLSGTLLTDYEHTQSTCTSSLQG